jgi:hypothetical protein
VETITVPRKQITEEQHKLVQMFLNKRKNQILKKPTIFNGTSTVSAEFVKAEKEVMDQLGLRRDITHVIHKRLLFFVRHRVFNNHKIFAGVLTALYILFDDSMKADFYASVEDAKKSHPTVNFDVAEISNSCEDGMHACWLVETDLDCRSV